MLGSDFASPERLANAIWIAAAGILIITLLALALGIVDMTERCVLLAIRLPTLICQRIRLHISHCDWVLRWKKSVVWYWLNAVWERKFCQKSGL
jgi:hypothetical protein